MFSAKDIVFNDSATHTELEIRNYIKANLQPDAPAGAIMTVRNMYIYEFDKYNRSLDYCIYSYKQKLQADEWRKSRHKKYWRISMPNGINKFVYMCEDQLRHIYPNHEFMEV